MIDLVIESMNKLNKTNLKLLEEQEDEKLINKKSNFFDDSEKDYEIINSINSSINLEHIEMKDIEAVSIKEDSIKEDSIKEECVVEYYTVDNNEAYIYCVYIYCIYFVLIFYLTITYYLLL